MWLEGIEHRPACIRFEIESQREKKYCNLNFNFFIPNDNADCFDSSKIHEVIFSGAVVYGKLQL